MKMIIGLLQFSFEPPLSRNLGIPGGRGYHRPLEFPGGRGMFNLKFPGEVAFYCILIGNSTGGPKMRFFDRGLYIYFHYSIEYPQRKENPMNFHGDRIYHFGNPTGEARPREYFLGDGVYSTGFSMGRDKKERVPRQGGGGVRIKIAIAHQESSQ
jgi:hypothetical protein